ncbi:MAG: RHS repeat protein, partial [Lachnospiraceae bacterium]|nr:RHS repeat protein [Lachnospiraceae bacterium]
MKKRSGKIILLLLCFILSFQIINGKKDTFFLVCKAKTGTPAKYEYDKLGRVKKIIYNDNRVVEYKYDANGNILEVKIKDNNSTTEEKKDNREDTDKQEKDVDNQDAFQEPSKDNN